MQRLSLTTKLPAYTNEMYKSDVSYFPCVGFSEDANLLITTLFFQLQLHHDRTGRWPRVMYIAVDSKSTNQCYNFVTAIVELVQISRHLEIEEAFLLFSEPGHHIMKIEHMHSRLNEWFKVQTLIDSLDKFREELDGKRFAEAQFTIRPISWVYDFAKRYRSCLSSVTTGVIAKISERRLAHITRDTVTFYNEPTTDPFYAEHLGLKEFSKNNSYSFDKWFEKPPINYSDPWALMDCDILKKAKKLRKVTNDFSGLQKMLDEIKANRGRTSRVPEMQLFWYDHVSGSRGATEVQNSVKGASFCSMQSNNVGQSEQLRRAMDEYRPLYRNASMTIPINQTPRDSSSTASSAASASTGQATPKRASTRDAGQRGRPANRGKANAKSKNKRKAPSCSSHYEDEDDSDEEHSTSSSEGLPRIFSNKFAHVIFENQIWTCNVIKISEINGKAKLRTLNPGPWQGEEWSTTLNPTLEGNLHDSDGWKWVNASEAAATMRGPPQAAPITELDDDFEEPPPKRTKK